MAFRQPFRGGWQISQGYGEKITSSFHTGIDYACPVGTEILASAEGVVVFAGWDPTGYGLCVILRHKMDKATLYAHLRTVAVSRGDLVKMGQKIGTSGDSGNVTGPHLHFEARHKWDDYKSHFDPMTLPMMTIDDSISEKADDINEKNDEVHTSIPGGTICRIACSAAWVRKWDTLDRYFLLHKGDTVYVFPQQIVMDGLPFRYIGAGLCVAEYDSEGTTILEADDGDKKEN